MIQSLEYCLMMWNYCTLAPHSQMLAHHCFLMLLMSTMLLLLAYYHLLLVSLLLGHIVLNLALMIKIVVLWLV